MHRILPLDLLNNNCGNKQDWKKENRVSCLKAFLSSLEQNNKNVWFLKTNFCSADRTRHSPVGIPWEGQQPSRPLQQLAAGNWRLQIMLSALAAPKPCSLEMTILA